MALSDKEFFEKLKADPKLLEHFKKLFLIAYGTGENEITKADDAEEAVIRGLRGLGHDILNNWASTQEEQSVKGLKRSVPGVKGHSKKNSNGQRVLVKLK